MKYGLHVHNRLKYSEAEVAGESTEKLPGAVLTGQEKKKKERNMEAFFFPLKEIQACFASKI